MSKHRIGYLCLTKQHITMKSKFLATLMMTVLLCACHEKHTFEVSGHITSADESTLFLEGMTLNGITAIDSCQLDEEGDFCFTVPSPKGPDFYRLRILQHIIPFSIDSTEQIRITADVQNMSTKYKIEGSYNCERIKELSLGQIQLENEISAILANKEVSTEGKSRMINEKIEKHKNHLKKDYILDDPAAPYAYFALFQTIGGQLIFNPINNPDDIRFVGAVATAWDAHYPTTTRAENLRNIALQGRKNIRPQTPIKLEGLNPEQISTTGIIDIELPDRNGTMRSLADIKNKVVLLDFTAYSLPESGNRIMQMRELYKQYHHKGLEIFQISIDPSEHYWKTACEQLPWICVYDRDREESQYIRSYQIYRIPSYFLINRQGDLVARDAQINDLETTIKKLLKK